MMSYDDSLEDDGAKPPDSFDDTLDSSSHSELLNMLGQAADPACRLCDGTGIFYGNVGICGCVNSAHRQKVLDAAMDHAQSYRKLFFDFRDKHEEAQDYNAALQRIIKKQRAIIAGLEEKLGIDQEL